MAGKLVSVNLSDLAYARIRKMITEFRFPPGGRLNVEGLSRKLGVSRTPIWEAIRRLEQEGLVRNVPNRGVFLMELTRDAAAEIHAVRAVLEAMAARLAAAFMTDSALERMETSIREQEKRIAEGDPAGYYRSDFNFHAEVYTACGNAVLKEVLESLRNKARLTAVRLSPIPPWLVEDHREIVRALWQRDPDLAEAAFREHNKKVLALVLAGPEALKAPEPGNRRTRKENGGADGRRPR